MDTADSLDSVTDWFAWYSGKVLLETLLTWSRSYFSIWIIHCIFQGAQEKKYTDTKYICFVFLVLTQLIQIDILKFKYLFLSPGFTPPV